MSDLLQLVAPVSIQAAAPAGKRPTAHIVAYGGDVVTVPGFGPIVIDLAGMALSPSLPILIDHRNELGGIVGTGTPRIDAGRQLLVDGILADTPEGGRVVALAKSGFAWSASVGAEPLETEFVREGDTITANGRRIQSPPGGFAFAKKSRLREVSLTPVGCDPGASVSIAASLQRSFTVGNENQTNQTTNQPANVQIPEEMKFAWDRAGLSDAERVELRLSAFRRDHGDVLPDFGNGMIRAAQTGAMTWPDAEREILRGEVRAMKLREFRAEMPQAPAIRGSRRDLQPAVIECAFASQLNVQSLDKVYPAEVLEAASTPRMRSIGLQQLLIEAAHANGYTGSQFVRRDNLKEVLAYAFPPMIQAASSIFVSGVLSNLANKVLVDGFNRVPQKWREVAAIKSVKDFKQATFYRLSASLEYEELPPAGTIKHGTLGEESYTGQARTYAKMLSLTRTDIINDDLGAFDDLRTRIGMGGAIALNKLFWTTWLAASNAGTFWTEARGNLVTATFGDEGIATALAGFRKAQAPDGNLLDLEPDRILTGPTLEAAARRFYVSAEIRDTTASKRDATANIWQNRYRPVAVAQLENEAYTGYSASTWYLAADPAILASAAVLFLDGQQQPTVESSDADFDQLGIQLRGYHDFGVSMAEYRASTKCVAGG